MTDAPVKISLGQQIEAMDMACTRQRAMANGSTVRPLMPKRDEEYQLVRLQAALKTLRWLGQHEEQLVAWLALPKETRAELLALGQARKEQA